MNFYGHYLTTKKIIEQSTKNKAINKLLRAFRETDNVIVPTDQRNLIQIIQTKRYVEIVKDNMEISESGIRRAWIVELYDDSWKYLISLEGRIPKLVYQFIREALNSKAIPSPKVLIKYHKKLNESGNYPTILVIPATNFTATFEKVGFLGNKSILDRNSIIYSRFTIQNAHNLKKALETNNFRREKNMAFALDIENMYPQLSSNL